MTLFAAPTDRMLPLSSVNEEDTEHPVQNVASMLPPRHNEVERQDSAVHVKFGQETAGGSVGAENTTVEQTVASGLSEEEENFVEMVYKRVKRLIDAQNEPVKNVTVVIMCKDSVEAEAEQNERNAL